MHIIPIMRRWARKSKILPMIFHLELNIVKSTRYQLRININADFLRNFFQRLL